MSIHEVRPGVWAVRWRQGKVNRKRTIGKKSDAKRFDEEVNRLKRMGQVASIDAGTETLEAFGVLWWKRRGESLSANTRRVYSATWDAQVLPRLGDMRLCDIDAGVIEDWLFDMRRDGVGKEVQRKAFKMLRGVLQRAVEWDRLPRNTAKLVPLPPSPDSEEIKPLSPHQVEKMRTYLLSKGRIKDALMISVLGYSGLRPEEALGLTWGHVRDRTILIEQVDEDGEIRIRTKTSRHRTVKLLAPLGQDLAEYKIMIGRPKDSHLIFPNRDGQPVSANAQNKWRSRVFDKAKEEAGIGKATPYYLRHSFASLLIWEGRPISYVASQLGHSPQMTLRTYAHVIDELVDAKPMSAEEAIRKARWKVARTEKKAA